jgi:hypothetical protein
MDSRLMQTLLSKRDGRTREQGLRLGTMTDAATGRNLAWGCRTVVADVVVGERSPRVSYEGQVRDDQGVRGDSSDIDDFGEALRRALEDYFQRFGWASSS